MMTHITNTAIMHLILDTLTGSTTDSRTHDCALANLPSLQPKDVTTTQNDRTEDQTLDIATTAALLMKLVWTGGSAAIVSLAARDELHQQLRLQPGYQDFVDWLLSRKMYNQSHLIDQLIYDFDAVRNVSTNGY